MDKISMTMLRQILAALSHMTSISAEAEQEILSEIERIHVGGAPKKKEEVVEVAEKEEKPLKNK